MNKRETWHTPIAKPTDTMIDRRRLPDKAAGYLKYLVLLVLVSYPRVYYKHRRGMGGISSPY